MSAAQNALFQAIYARLSSDSALTGLVGEDAIFDRLLPKAKLPAIVFGTCESQDWSTATEDGSEILLTIEIWSEAEGRRALQAVEAQVRALLHDGELTLDGFHLVNLTYRTTRTRRQPRTGLFLAEMRFRAVIEPN